MPPFLKNAACTALFSKEERGTALFWYGQKSAAEGRDVLTGDSRVQEVPCPATADNIWRFYDEKFQQQTF